MTMAIRFKTMPQLDPIKLLPQVVELTKQAGQKIMSLYSCDFSIVQKKDDSPVTEADMAAHAMIDDGLEEIAEQYPVLSEESTAIHFEDRVRWERYWLVDPLDGTREFIDCTDEFTVNIALIENHSPILGVIYAPALNVSYFAARNFGAYKQEGDGIARRIHVHKHRRNKAIIAGSRAQRSDSLNQFLKNLGDYEFKIMGSSLKSCMVAEGKADIYPRLGPTAEWDTAAAHCIVEEAGGHMTDINMQTLAYNTKDSLLNPHFFVFGDSSVIWADYL